MYTRIKDNLVNPRALYNRRYDKFGKSLLYFLFLVFLLSINSIIDTVRYNELSSNDKSQMKLALEEQMDIPCSIDYGLICETDEIHKVSFANLNILFDPTGDYIPEDLGMSIILREENVYFFNARTILYSIDYGNPTESFQEWPVEWSVIDIDPDSDEFWDSLFLGLDRLIDDYKPFWLPISIISSIIAFSIVLLTEILIDTLILSLFRFGGLRFREMFKLVLNAVTAYVLISVILDLYSINLGTLMRSVMQMIPIIYVIVATRTQRGEGNV